MSSTGNVCARLPSNGGPHPASHSLLSDFITPEHLAKELGVSVRTLARWRVRRIGPASIAIGRKRLYRREAVSEWLANIESAGHATVGDLRGEERRHER